MPKVLGVIEGSISGSDNLEQQQNSWIETKERKITYVVLADNAAQDEETIKNTTGVPPLFYPMYGMSCRSRKATQTRTVIHPTTGVVTCLWDVECSFSSKVDPSQEQDNPESKRPVVEWSSETEEEVLEKDAQTDLPIQTEAGEPISILYPTTVIIQEITRYQLYPFDPDIIFNYVNHVNENSFWGAPPGCAWMSSISATEEMITVSDVQTLYVKATYRIKYKIRKESGTMVEDSWVARVLHQGYKFRKAAGEIAQIYVDKQGNPATVNLGAGGIKLGKDDPPEYITFNKFPKANFNSLSLNGPF